MPVRCIETGVIYDTYAEAARDTNTYDNGIRNVCDGKANTAGGYHWEFIGERPVVHKANICFDCKKAVLGCSWSRDFIPVPGWTATPTIIRSTSGRHNIMETESYAITACPEFEEG